MIKVNNKKVVRRLADRSLKANKIRNMMASLAIILTTLLFTTLFTLGIGTIESFQTATMRQAGGDGHALLKYITDDEFNRVKNHPLIKEIAYNRMLADDIENEDFLKRHTEIWYMDDVGMKLGFCEPTKGHKPIKENEVIADTKTLALLGVPEEVGATFTLDLLVHNKKVERQFVLSGWWESDPAFNSGMIITSRAYVDAHEAELKNTYKEDYSLSGAINAYIMFDNSMNLEHKLSTVLNDSGFSMDEQAPGYIASNVNWAYVSTNFGMDFGTIIICIGGLLLITFTGYLIIYNIFQLSIRKDIRFYGLLKTIGTTSRQIKRMITRQALCLAIISIPIGLVGGFFVGRYFVPLLINQSTYAGTKVSISPNPWIFIGATLFALMTVLISTYKPGRMAAKVSPIEAVRYIEVSRSTSKKQKKVKKGAKMLYMAFYNLGRHKKQTLLVIMSLSLSLVLFNTVFTLSQSIDMDKFLSKFVDTDFLIAHADYFQNDFYGQDNEVTEIFIEAVENKVGFEEGGRLYGGRAEIFTATDPENVEQEYNIDDKGDFFAALYGLEEVPMNRLEVLDGEMNLEKLATGQYILEGIYLDDNGRPYMEDAKYAVGEVVTLHNYRETSEGGNSRTYTSREFIVLGHVAVNYYSNSDRSHWDYTFYLPAQIYKSLVDAPAIMSYAYNVEDSFEEEMEVFLKDYTENSEPTMNYTSKRTSLEEFKDMQRMVLMIGGTLSFVIGLIGILNFINAHLTSIFSRRKEFAMLQSIGMTKKQLRHMLMFEGSYYALGTCVIAFIFNIIISLSIVRISCNQMWFLSYHFMIWPLLSIMPALLLISILIPCVTYKLTGKQSIIERLREIE